VFNQRPARGSSQSSQLRLHLQELQLKAIAILRANGVENADQDMSLLFNQYSVKMGLAGEEQATLDAAGKASGWKSYADQQAEEDADPWPELATAGAPMSPTPDPYACPGCEAAEGYFCDDDCPEAGGFPDVGWAEREYAKLLDPDNSNRILAPVQIKPAELSQAERQRRSIEFEEFARTYFQVQPEPKVRLVHLRSWNGRRKSSDDLATQLSDDLATRFGDFNAS